jgi:hypothetical protein
MQEGRSKNSHRGGARLEGRAARRNKKKSDSRLERLARMVGNEEIKRQIQRGNATRDAMLTHLCERLRVMRQLQLRELNLTQRGAHYSWWRDAADAQKLNLQEPEPTRWNQAAKTYEEASRALCRGDVSRGKHLMADAMELERQAHQTLTDLVELTDLEFDAKPDDGHLADIASTAPAGRCEEPDDVDIARDIYNVTTTVEDMPNRKRTRDPWWTLDEDEEEEESADGGGS